MDRSLDRTSKILEKKDELLRMCRAKYCDLDNLHLEGIVSDALVKALEDYRGNDEKSLHVYLEKVCHAKACRIFDRERRDIAYEDDFESLAEGHHSTILNQGSPVDPAELLAQRETIRDAIVMIQKLSTADEKKLFEETIKAALQGHPVQSRLIEQKFGWSSKKIDKMTTKLNKRINFVKASVLGAAIFITQSIRRIFHSAGTSNAEAAVSSSAAASAGSVALSKVAAISFITVAAGTIGTFTYHQYTTSDTKPHVLHRQLIHNESSSPFQSSFAMETTAVPYSKISHQRQRGKKHPRKHKKRHNTRTNTTANQKPKPAIKTPTAPPKVTPPASTSSPSSSSQPSSPSPSSRGEGDAEFGVDEP